MVFFLDRVSQTIYLGWLPTSILLIFVFGVARIIDVCHQHLDMLGIFERAS
jgi:hypothetical protein